jgi:hypothetical protein
MAEPEERTEEAIQVRQVTDYQASWTEEEPWGEGAFTFQLILDDGAELYVLQPTAEDAKVIRKLLGNSEALTWDLHNRTLVVNNISLGG